MRTISLSRIFVILWTVLMAIASSPDQPVLRADTHGHHNTPLKDVPVVVNVNLHQSHNTINDHFIGHSLGFPNYGVHLAPFLGSQKLLTIARALSPAYVRMAGNFVSGTPYKVTKADLWDKMNHFFKTVGWNQIHVLDDHVHHKDGSWRSDKARVLLQYSATHNYDIAGFELGNEYDIQGRHHPNTTLTPQQLAQGVQTLRGLLSQFHKYNSSFITGPDTAFVDHHYFQGFLSAGGHHVVRAATFHQYYFPGPQGKLSYFTDTKIMDKLGHKIDTAMSLSRAVNPHLPVWLTETGSASDRGAAGLSDRFAAGFLWLDKLGVCAIKGIPVLIRFVFYPENDYYGLIDKNLNPNPDFWLTVLYKRIVRGAVFNATARHDVRVYAACANKHNFKAGGLAVYMLNPNNYPVTFDLPQFQNQPRFRYSLTAGDKDGLTSRYIALNGVKLQMVNDHQLPPLKPESAPHGVVTVPAHSMTFLVFPDAGASICLH